MMVGGSKREKAATERRQSKHRQFFSVLSGPLQRSF
jgi:hypothetical protein